ncbi:hypothetical protein PoMZ_06137 [Pyricularia oryzae]|uniref:Uncharacterized protein n=1 Tax=Pyricularia oryzae TaxID=318829 RepID=A0A4P7NQA2_PYROR|nr:hypothetical protein PoMZ_06137 [Pyricularia oryzae]
MATPKRTRRLDVVTVATTIVVGTFNGACNQLATPSVASTVPSPGSSAVASRGACTVLLGYVLPLNQAIQASFIKYMAILDLYPSKQGRQIRLSRTCNSANRR